jgi:hypothetical protein
MHNHLPLVKTSAMAAAVGLGFRIVSAVRTQESGTRQAAPIISGKFHPGKYPTPHPRFKGAVGGLNRRVRTGIHADSVAAKEH